LVGRRHIILAPFLASALAARFAPADAYDPPATYYDYATGYTGTTLKQRLHALIDTVDDPGVNDIVETTLSYDSARSSLQVTDADTENPGRIITVYDRTSLNVSGFNTSGIPGWDGGTTWNREHTWPRSRGVGSSGPDDSDLFNLRPALTSNNGDRGNLNFGGAYNAQFWGVVSDGGSKWYPGNADAGMIARQEFYMAVRFDAAEPNTTDLELFSGNPSTAQGLGDLSRMLEWHFAAPPETFERRRNQVIFDNYQHNRNPFIDHPEYVWSIFAKDINGNLIPNDNQVSIAGVTVNFDGSSTRNVDLGRVFVGDAVPAAQLFTLNKDSNNANGNYGGTYFEVSTGGAATSSISGRLNAFRTTQTDSKTITIGLNTNTAAAGLRSGTVTIDNLDITAGGGAGRGVNDVNDTFNVSLTVLDHVTPTYASSSTVTSLTHDFGNIALGSNSAAFNFDVFNKNATVGYTANMDFDSVTPSGNSSAFTTDLAASAGSLVLAGGASHTFTSNLIVTTVGTFSATYTLVFSDENIAGAENKSLTLTLTGKVRLAGDYNGDSVVDAADYSLWRRTYGQSMTAYSGADGDGNGAVGDGDLTVWQSNFGLTASWPGSSLILSAVPEPASVALVLIALLVGTRIRRC
jgi:endonuclease I